MRTKPQMSQKTSNSTKADPVRSSRSFTQQHSHPVLQLQQQLGNQAVQRLLDSKRIHAKLTIGQPDDKYEQEADRVADQVMRMPDPAIQRDINDLDEDELEQGKIQTKPLATTITPAIQRLCPGCEEELQLQPTEEIEKEEEDEEKKRLQAKEMPGQTLDVSHELEGTINSLRSGGQVISSSDRNFFEPRFAQDFNQVRIHTDTRAAYVARSINAKAFTTGKNILFGAGEYSPNTSEGKRLLAHELTHVVQQTGLSFYPNLTTSRSEKIQRAVDPISAVGLGLAVFALVHSLAPYGSKGLSWSRNIAKAVHKWPPGKKPAMKHWIKNWTTRLLDISCISGLSSAWGMWMLSWNWNGADIDQAHAYKLGSSSWAGGSTGSELKLSFELSDASDSYESGGKAAMMCYINGSPLDPSGAGDIDFAGRILIFADGSSKRVGNLRITRGDKSDFTITNWGQGWKIKKD